MILGILLSAAFWWRLSRRDSRLMLIYLAALLGAFTGAKLLYLIAEGWIDWGEPDRWQRLAAGKTVIGALLGGYASVEWAKRLLGYPQATGDWFASVVPLGIALGRIGCWSAGCCLGSVCVPSWYTLQDQHGIARWPSVPLEFGFNILALATFSALRQMGLQRGQHFHLYLIAYGLFRFAHEWFRSTPKWGGWVSGYQLGALALMILGLLRYRQRGREQSISCPH